MKYLTAAVKSRYIDLALVLSVGLYVALALAAPLILMADLDVISCDYCEGLLNSSLVLTGVLAAFAFLLPATVLSLVLHVTKNFAIRRYRHLLIDVGVLVLYFVLPFLVHRVLFVLVWRD